MSRLDSNSASTPAPIDVGGSVAGNAGSSILNGSASPSAGPVIQLDSEVGKYVVESGLATRDEVNACREQQKQASDPNARSLSDLLVENNYVTHNQVKRIRRHLEERRSSQIPGYQLLGLLGKGAMAKVYKAKQISLDRMVAIKVLPKKSNENQDFVDRFYREGKAAARLAHNNIV